MENRFWTEIGDLRSEVRDPRGRLWWLMGIQIFMWITIILTILLKA